MKAKGAEKNQPKNGYTSLYTVDEFSYTDTEQADNLMTSKSNE